MIIPAPSDTAVEVLALTEPLACVVRAARKSRMTFGQSVIVIGAGPIVNLNVQMARLVGAAPIIVAETSPERAEMACEAGADIAVTNPGLLSETVRKNTAGRGADVVIESVGHPDLYQEAFRLIRPGGHVTTFGITDPGDSVPLDLLQTVLRENSIKGSVAVMGQDMHDVLTLLIHNRIVPRYFTDALCRRDRRYGNCARGDFGPVSTVMPFDTVEEAITIANDTEYGLAASVWTKNIDKALTITRRVQEGRFWVNTKLSGGPEPPIGGFKQSGWGREAGIYVVEEYTQIKSVHIEIGKRTHWIS